MEESLAERIHKTRPARWDRPGRAGPAECPDGECHEPY